jgi:molybdate transport system substrate-binding protein
MAYLEVVKMKGFKGIAIFIALFAVIVFTTVLLTYTKIQKPASLTISVATSLKDSMQEIAKLYKEERSGVAITFNFGASGALQKQIEHGAPVDLFISAGRKQMDTLKEKELLDNSTIMNLLRNELVLITPKNSNLVIKGFTDLANKNLKTVAVGEPRSVPAGQYAEEALKYYNILDGIKSKTVQAKDVREILTWVEGGNADAGIVYKTDAMVSQKVKVAAIAPESSHSPIEYPAAVIKGSKYTAASKDFLAYLSGNKAQAVFEKYGFRMEAK